jgi:uncharacterized protein (TIGR02145 family)
LPTSAFTRFALILPFLALLASCSQDPAVNSPGEVNEGTLPTCVIMPARGYFRNVNAVKITVSCPTPEAIIRYTLDGSAPNRYSTRYADSIKPTSFTNILDIKVRAWSGNDSSPWVQAVLMDSLQDPFYVYRGDSLFARSLQVKLFGSFSNAGWSFLYTTDGSEPSGVAGGATKAYASQSQIQIEGQTTLRVKAVRGALVYPVILEHTYTPTPPYEGPFGTLLDERDGQSYRTIRIGTQTWMAENLRFRSTSNGATCYVGDSSFCGSDGVLYRWSTVMDIDSSFDGKSWTGSDRGHRGLCPAGSHVPSDSEWTQLQLAVQALPKAGAANADLALISDTGWLNNRAWKRDALFQSIMVQSYSPGEWPNNGVDMIGFNVLPTGKRRGDGVYLFRSYYAGFWSSTPSTNFTNFSWARNFYGGFRGIHRDVGNDRKEGLSVRCVLDS